MFEKKEKNNKEKESKKKFKPIEKLNIETTKSNLIEMSYTLGTKWEIFFKNIWAGIGRGIGFGIGVTIISAILIYILQKIMKLNIPVIGEYISDIVEIVQNNRKY